MDTHGVVLSEQAIDDGDTHGLPEIQPCLVASHLLPVGKYLIPPILDMQYKLPVDHQMADTAFRHTVANDLASDIVGRGLRMP